MTRPGSLDSLVRRSADPERVSTGLDRLAEARPELAEQLEADETLARTVVDVLGASRWLSRLLASDDAALDVLADLDFPVPQTGIEDGRSLAAWCHREHLRIAARDLGQIDPLETTMTLITRAAARVMSHSLRIGEAEQLAVIGFGKAGGRELNYSSDVDVVLVGPDGPADVEAARRALAVANHALRIDVDLRPEGRDGPLVRTIDGYRAHWERWAEPWERQALLKSRPLAGDADLGSHFATAAADAVWGRGFDAEAILAVRQMKARTERHALAGRDGARDLKRAPGGIRDIEFSTQLLQLVHGPLDEALRVRGTLPALTALADGGYVDSGDAGWLRASYRLLRRVEHAVQLDEARQVHAVPAEAAERDRIARTLGIEPTPAASAVQELDRELKACRATVRTIHERLYFRPLLDAFTEVDAPLSPDAAAARLKAFGFADVDRTRQAVAELTRGLTRTSRLMASVLPLVLDWLSAAPDPDQGLLALRTLVADRAQPLVAALRESTETARRLSVLAGSSPLLVKGLIRAPELLAELGRPDGDDRATVLRRVHLTQPGLPARLAADRTVTLSALTPPDEALGRRPEVGDSNPPEPPAAAPATTSDAPSASSVALPPSAGSGASAATRNEAGVEQVRAALRRTVRRELTRIGIGDVLDDRPAAEVGADLATVAHAAVDVALAAADPQVPFAVLALGRLAGGELDYASDLDLLFVHGADPDDEAGRAEANRVGDAVRRTLVGTSAADRVYEVDLDLRPGGRSGLVTPSREAVVAHVERWVEPWQVLALNRLRPLSGDAELTRGLLAELEPMVRHAPSESDRKAVRRVKARSETERVSAGEDPRFHLKASPGALADIDVTVALLQWENGLFHASTDAGIEALATAGHIDRAEADDLAAALAFCQRTRNRSLLVAGRPRDAIPTGDDLTVLARSLDTTAPALRDEFLRLTRRARRVVEHHVYGT